MVDDNDKRQMKINSIYRSERLNKFIGGHSKSAHVEGRAIDFEIVGIDNKTLWEWIIREGKRGFVFHHNILERYSMDTLRGQRSCNDPEAGWIHLSLPKEIVSGIREGEILRKSFQYNPKK